MDSRVVAHYGGDVTPANVRPRAGTDAGPVRPPGGSPPCTR